jgi:hypothetical protein
MDGITDEMKEWAKAQAMNSAWRYDHALALRRSVKSNNQAALVVQLCHHGQAPWHEILKILREWGYELEKLK